MNKQSLPQTSAKKSWGWKNPFLGAWKLKAENQKTHFATSQTKMRERIRRPPYFLNPKCNIPSVRSLPGLQRKERSQYQRVKRLSIDECRDLDKVRREVSRRTSLLIDLNDVIINLHTLQYRCRHWEKSSMGKTSEVVWNDGFFEDFCVRTICRNVEQPEKSQVETSTSSGSWGFEKRSWTRNCLYHGTSEFFASKR